MSLEALIWQYMSTSSKQAANGICCRDKNLRDQCGEVYWMDYPNDVPHVIPLKMCSNSPWDPSRPSEPLLMQKCLVIVCQNNKSKRTCEGRSASAVTDGCWSVVRLPLRRMIPDAE